MLSGIRRIVTSRAAGWACSAAAVGVIAAQALTVSQSERESELLRGKIAALASRDATGLKGALASCHATVRSYAAALAASAPRAAETAHAVRVKASGDAVAEALVSTPPAGVDVCARMESADQAVLKALDRR